MKLIVGLDSLSPPLTGIGYYTLHLLELFRARRDIELHGISYQGWWSAERIEQFMMDETVSKPIVSEPSRAADIGAQRLRAAIRDVPVAYCSAKWLRSLRCERLLREAPAGAIYHEPNFVAYPFSGRTVLTVHDLSHIRYPQAHPSSRVAYLNKHLPRAVGKASVVITDSEFTKQEMLALGLVKNEELVRVTHLGYDHGFRPRMIDEFWSVLQRFSLEARGYVLAVATLEPRKNFERLLTAYNRLPPALAEAYPLVLVGGGGWKGERLSRLLANVKHPYRVIVTGYLPREDVQALMSAAAVFAYPSLYEGFGLPVLEAMASDTAVLTSDNTSLDEVAGDAAYKVPPQQTDAILDGLRTLLESESMRDRYRAMGLRRAMHFSWARCAEQTLDAYRLLS